MNVHLNIINFVQLDNMTIPLDLFSDKIDINKSKCDFCKIPKLFPPVSLELLGVP